ncbi:MAG: tRNA (adenosine(37)-N6)-threonylcarbamoyltransferase complex transferase subunit TsaD [Thermoproteota archaeon]|nr:tRNA (adenosine(37)-N6)-threonylcarbamoyltransferase complex transferase subunit TsaD [Thermoproteota archaeon]
MLCLGIESTAHTFASSVTDYSDNNKQPVIMSDARRIYVPPAGSGIHPREASRHHASVSARIIDEALCFGKIKCTELSIVAYSAGPGLGPCLRVGAVAARSIASFYNKPLIPVNHAIGHIELGICLTEAHDPLVLLVSGGHTVMTVFADRRWRVIGETLDITLGQLFDQFGRCLGFSSPCGSKIEQLAMESSGDYCLLPYTVKGNDVTFSGLLSALKRLHTSNYPVNDLCFSLQETAFAMICETLERALVATGKKELLVVGGVAANMRLAEILKAACNRHGVQFHACPVKYSGDNGVQIAWTGTLFYVSNKNSGTDISESFVRQSWRLDQVDLCWKC